MTRTILLALVMSLAALGCGPDKPPPQATDPEALKREATEGRDLRNKLEGTK